MGTGPIDYPQDSLTPCGGYWWQHGLLRMAQIPEDDHLHQLYSTGSKKMLIIGGSRLSHWFRSGGKITSGKHHAYLRTTYNEGFLQRKLSGIGQRWVVYWARLTAIDTTISSYRTIRGVLASPTS